MQVHNDVLNFWLKGVAEEDWYRGNTALDERVRDTFEHLWHRASQGELRDWTDTPDGSLAYILVTDQFPRNMFRGSGRAFSSDRAALTAAKAAIGKGWDLKIDEPARQFFYLPLMHSENLCDQDRCVRLMHERMPKAGADNLLHARAHREVIRQFGRFPYRNEVLQRSSTGAESAYVSNGGYGRTVRELQAVVG